MPIRKVGEGPGAIPPSEGSKKISSTLARNVGDTTNVAQKAEIYRGKTNLSGRCSFPFKCPENEGTAAEANMLRWPPFLHP